MSRSIGWLVAVVGLVALALSGYWLSRPEEARADEAAQRGFVVPVVLTTLQRGDVAPRATLSGTVRAARRARLGFDTGGIVAKLGASEADRVKAGAVLAELARGDEEHEVVSAEASLQLAARQYDLLVAGAREEEKRRLEAVLQAAVAATELARLEVRRGEKLLVDRIIAESEQDTRLAALEVADKRRAAAEHELAEALAGTRPEDLAVAAARVDEAEARLDTARHELSKTELRAPWPGSIVLRYVSVGDYLSAGDPVFELVDLGNLEVHLSIPGRFAPRVDPGSRVRLTLERGEEAVLELPLYATIPAADEAARSFRGIVRIGAKDDPRGHFKPGMFVQVELGLRPVVDALVVDSDAVLANERGSYVVRAAAGETGPMAELVPVRVLAESDGVCAIEAFGPSDLAEGDELVLVGADNAFPGAALLPRGDGDPPASGSGQESVSE